MCLRGLIVLPFGRRVTTVAAAVLLWDGTSAVSGSLRSQAESVERLPVAAALFWDSASAVPGSLRSQAESIERLPVRCAAEDNRGEGGTNPGGPPPDRTGTRAEELVQ